MNHEQRILIIDRGSNKGSTIRAGTFVKLIALLAISPIAPQMLVKAIAPQMLVKAIAGNYLHPLRSTSSFVHPKVPFMKSKPRPHYHALVMTCSLLFSVASEVSSANGAIVAYTDFAAFTIAAEAVTGATVQVIDFDSLTAGTPLVGEGGMSFAINEGELRILNTFPETISGPNYIGDDLGFNISEQLDEFQVVTISMSMGDERSAFGLWVQYDPQIQTNTGSMALIANRSSIEAAVDPFSGVRLDPDPFGATDEAYFIGLVESTGTNLISTIDLFNAGLGEIGYTFDNVISYQVVAVPEPSSIALCCLVGAGTLILRRRRNRKADH